MLTIAQAQARWRAGLPITVACETQARHYGAPRGRAASWCYITCFRIGSQVYAAPSGATRAPDPNLWRAVGAVEEGFQAPLANEHAHGGEEALAWWLALATVGAPINTYRPDGWILLAPTLCACGRLLTTPTSILEGAGPICSGRAEAARQRTEAKRRLARDMDIHEMRRRITGV